MGEQHLTAQSEISILALLNMPKRNGLRISPHRHFGHLLEDKLCIAQPLLKSKGDSTSELSGISRY